MSATRATAQYKEARGRDDDRSALLHFERFTALTDGTHAEDVRRASERIGSSRCVMADSFRRAEAKARADVDLEGDRDEPRSIGGGAVVALAAALAARRRRKGRSGSA